MGSGFQMILYPVFHKYQVKLEERILPNHVMVVPPNVLTWFMFIQV